MVLLSKCCHQIWSFFTDSERYLLPRILSPLKIVRLEKGAIYLWLLFTILAGLIGPFINIVNNYYFHDEPISLSLWQDSITGTFYTYAVVLIASSIGVMFVKLIEEDIKYKKVKLFFISVCIFPLLFGGIFYSSHTQIDHDRELKTVISYKTSLLHANNETELKRVKKNITENSDIDRKQLFFLCLSVLISLYALCLQYVPKHPEEFKSLLDNYSKEEDESIENMTVASGGTESIGGIEL